MRPRRNVTLIEPFGSGCALAQGKPLDPGVPELRTKPPGRAQDELHSVGKRGPRGFTLIELLAVIAVISLLLTILTPVLRRAKRAAQEAVCASNMAQLATTIVTYANNYDGWFPFVCHRTLPKPTRDPPTPPWGRAGMRARIYADWRDLLRDEYGVTGRLIFSPSNLQWGEVQGNAHVTWDTAHWEPGTPAGWQIIGYTYFFITGMDHRDQSVNAVLDGVRFPKALHGRYDTDILWGDLTHQYFQGGFYGLGKQRANHIYGEDEPVGAHTGHVDGHVEWKQSAELDGPHPEGNHDYWW